MTRGKQMEHVKCNECGYVGSLYLYWSEEHVATTRDHGDITAIFIECPNCGDRHFSYLKDEVSLNWEAKLKELHDLYERLLFTGDPSEFERRRGEQFRQEFLELQEELREHRRKLHEEYAPTEGEDY